MITQVAEFLASYIWDVFPICLSQVKIFIFETERVFFLTTRYDLMITFVEH